MNRVGARLIVLVLLFGCTATHAIAQTSTELLPAPPGAIFYVLIYWLERIVAALAVGAAIGALIALRCGRQQLRRYAMHGAIGAAVSFLLFNLDDLVAIPGFGAFRSQMDDYGIDSLEYLLAFGNPCNSKLCYLSNRYDVFFEAVGAVIGVFAPSFRSFVSVTAPDGVSPFDAADPACRVARAVVVSVGLGFALLLYALIAGPRDFIGRLQPITQIMLVCGVVVMASIPLSIWRRCAPRLHFAVLAAACAALGILLFSTADPRGPYRDWIVPIKGVFLFVAILLFLEWFRLRRAHGAGLLRVSKAAFCWPFAGAGAIAATAARLPEEMLTAAFQLPDHTLRSRALVSAELERRALPSEFDPDWLPSPQHATLPPPVRRNITPDQYRRWMRNRKVFQTTFLILVIVATITIIGIALLLPLIVAIGLVGALAGRNRAARILLLRPFGQPQMTSALKRVVRLHLGLLGHTFTLSDRNYRPNYVLEALGRMFDWLMIVLGPLLRPSLRIARVTNERTFLKFANAVMRKTSLSWKGLLSGGQAFNIRTTDAWWKRCIDLLMHSSDLVVMDMSRVSAGSAWEVVQLGGRGLLSRCVFIAQEGYHADAMASFERLLPPGSHLHIHVFDASGTFADPAALDAALQAQVLGAIARWGDARPPLTEPTSRYSKSGERRESTVPSDVAAAKPPLPAASVPQHAAVTQEATHEQRVDAAPEAVAAASDERRETATSTDALAANLEALPPAAQEPSAPARQAVDGHRVEAEPEIATTASSGAPGEPAASAEPPTAKPRAQLAAQQRSAPTYEAADEQRVEPPAPVVAAAGGSQLVPLLAAIYLAAAFGLVMTIGWLWPGSEPRRDSAPISAQPVVSCTEAQSHWNSVEASPSILGYRDHLARFPACPFAAAARLRIDALEAAAQTRANEEAAARATCARYDAEVKRLDKLMNEAETAGLRAEPPFNPRKPTPKKAYAKKCELMARAVRYSDELKRLLAEKKAWCDQRGFSLYEPFAEGNAPLARRNLTYKECK